MSLLLGRSSLACQEPLSVASGWSIEEGFKMQTKDHLGGEGEILPLTTYGSLVFGVISGKAAVRRLGE
jgi:hypothetical protein